MLSAKAIAEYVDLRPYLSEVKSQGQRNTCSTFAASTLMEYLIAVETGEYLDLSPSFNYWALKEYTLDNEFLINSYLYSDRGVGYLAVEAFMNGSVEESEWPYESQNWYQQNDARCQFINGHLASQCFTGELPPDVNILPYGMHADFIEREKLADFMLKEKKPIVFNIKWCRSAVDSSNGFFTMPAPDETPTGCLGHVIVLVGYFEETKRFIYRNSWGPEWGDNGYGTVPEEYLIKYCESCEYLPSLSQYPKEGQELILNSSFGVSGTFFTTE